MSPKKILRSKTVFLATSALVICSGIARAQDAATVEEVVVTGSRLQTGFQTPTPVTAVSATQMNQIAPSTISDVVNQLPMMRQTTGNTQAPRNTGTGGQNLVDLRGLGVNRTLILVDGTRFVPTQLNGAVDVNLIPTNMVQRVDVVTGGASAAYGSDAVSGVVNFIMKDHIDGVQGSMQYGVSERGDNIEPAFSLAGGHDFLNGRLHVLAGGDWSNNHGVGTIYSRPDTYGKEQGCLVSNGTPRGAAVPASSLVTNCTYSTQAAGGLIVSGPLKGTAFGVGGAPYNFNYGTVAGTLMYGGAANPDDPHANPNGNWMLEAPHYRYTAMGKVSFDIDDDTTVFALYNYGHNEQKGLSSFHQEQNIVVNIDNPYIPAATKAAMVANGLTSISVGRQEEALGGYQFNQSDTVNRETVGIKGKIFGDWSWDATYTHGETAAPWPLLTNLKEANYLAAIYAVPGPNGVPVCGPVATNPNFATGGIGAGRQSQVSAGCVPFNIFGPSVNITPGNGHGFATAGLPSNLLNNPTASVAAANYINNVTDTGNTYQQDDIAANIHGTPFSLWAGPVSMAAGIEHRREGARSYTSYTGLELNNPPPGANYAGSFGVTEGYVEMGVPLAKDVSWADALNLDIAVREAGYELAGNRTTYKLGLDYSPNDTFRFRANRSRDVREPAISELFATQSSSITASFLNPITGNSGPEYTVSGGNPNLKPEVATSWTAGTIFTPHWIDGLQLSVDYYSVSIHGAIGSVPAPNVATYCAQGNKFYCQFVSNNGPGGALQIVTTLANQNLQHTDGFDIELDDKWSLEKVSLPGDISFRMLTTFVNSLSTTTNNSTLQLAGSGVGGGVSKWTSNINIDYLLGASDTNVQIRYTGDLLADATLVGPGQYNYNPAATNSINRNQYPASYYIDLTETYSLPDMFGTSVQLFANVKNILDKDEPALGLIAFATGGDPYDKIGRTYKGGLRFQF
jgi:iron complex outermembrane receptor protein